MPIKDVIKKKVKVKIPIHRCEFCKMPFSGKDSKNLALKCEEKGVEPFKFNSGDVVLVKDIKKAYPYNGKTVKLTEQIYYVGTHKKEYRASSLNPLNFLGEEFIDRKVA